MLKEKLDFKKTRKTLKKNLKQTKTCKTERKGKNMMQEKIRQKGKTHRGIFLVSVWQLPSSG